MPGHRTQCLHRAHLPVPLLSDVAGLHTRSPVQERPAGSGAEQFALFPPEVMTASTYSAEEKDVLQSRPECQPGLELPWQSSRAIELSSSGAGENYQEPSLHSRLWRLVG